MCILLSRGEQLAQHNFEERKGPYPKALADRLHEQGIMTRDEHLRQSLLRRKEHIERYAQQGPRRFYLGMDCSAEENAFIHGKSHALQADFFFPRELWGPMFEGFTELRRQRFRTHLTNWHGTAEQALFLLSYPEFEKWFDECVPNEKEHGRKKRILIDRVLANTKLLTKVTQTASTHTLGIIAERMFFDLSSNNVTLWNSGVLAMIVQALPEQHRHHFERLGRMRTTLHALPENGPSKISAHSKRQAIKKHVRICAYLLRGNPSIVRDAIKHIVDSLTASQTHSTALAA
ncbi:hypothetical protein K2Q00_00235 [Patescibacteria group bacterium]|nr:hypothetical protein [Patescibacteria group bacterium]